ncbi:hypothetical protein R3P38DRAFT_3229735 [Favolaschia claudopus]|uniref:C2H2-type domain-containing protein n=1 Tax=Favolaschia claudopus TaxID=2862362 RepID=A0AAV9ZNF8_9AGAR
MCGKTVKDPDRQHHIGEHILKALRGVKEVSARVPVSTSYPCGACGGTCSISIKNKKADSECPSAYPFLISTTKKFLPTRPCTNVPVMCAMPDCKQIHWKYNFKQHMEERHPGWEGHTANDFIDEIRISSAEQLELKIPTQRVLVWPPSPPPPRAEPVSARPFTPTAQKRSASAVPLSPRRPSARTDKENCDQMIPIWPKYDV